MVCSSKRDKYLKYFEGGRFGVQKRFLEAFIEGLTELKTSGEFLDFQTRTGIDDALVDEIFNGNYLVVDSELVDKLVPELHICGYGCLGKLDIPQDDIPMLCQDMSVPDWITPPEVKFMPLYVRVKAIKEL